MKFLEKKYLQVNFSGEDYDTIQEMMNLLNDLLDTMDKNNLTTCDTDDVSEYVTKEELEYFEKLLHKLDDVETLH